MLHVRPPCDFPAFWRGSPLWDFSAAMRLYVVAIYQSSVSVSDAGYLRSCCAFRLSLNVASTGLPLPTVARMLQTDFPYLLTTRQISGISQASKDKALGPLAIPAFA